MTSHSLFVDLDGVLADLEYKLFSLTGHRMHRLGDGEWWAHYHAYNDDGGDWFYDLKPMPDAHQLWDYVEKYSPTILTATGRDVEQAAASKRRWVMRHFGVPSERVITVRSSEDKAAYITGDSCILIDDNLGRSIKSWTDAGGIGILHTNARMSIAELQRLGL